jgi:hypothetical protein
MKTRRAVVIHSIVVAASLMVAGASAAQTPAQTFADLQPQLKFGQDVIVEGADGRRVNGKVVAISANELEIRRLRFFFREERRVFTEETARRIDRRDSTWNGGLIGAGVGALVLFAALSAPACNQPDDLSCAPLILAPVAGFIIGDGIDGAHNRTVFLGSGRTRAALSPLVGRSQVGVAAHLRF